MPYELQKCINFGCVNYINALPFSLPLLENSYLQLHLAPPAELLKKILHHEIDCALTSSIGTVAQKLQCLPGWGIAAHKHVQSVNLYTSSSFFSSSKPKVAITNESLSSVALFKILCHNLWQVPSPQIEHLSPSEIINLSPDRYDGLLLIGDAALKHPQIPQFTTHDLAQCWDELTGMPFVFAVVLNRTSWENCSSLIHLALESALSHFENSPQEVIETAHKRTNLSHKDLRTYYSLLRYRLGEEDYAGLKAFQQYYDRLLQKT